MRLPDPLELLNPATMLRLTRRGLEAAEQAIDLVPRLVGVVGQVEQLMVRVAALVTQIEHTDARADGVVSRTDGIVDRAAALVGRLEPLINRFEPALVKLEPMLARLADTTSPAEIDAMVTLIDTLPEVAQKFKADILPVLDTLGTVAPDLRDLLDVSRELNEMLGAVPGLGRIKRRIEEKQELEDQYRADEEPPSAPDRGE